MPTQKRKSEVRKYEKKQSALNLKVKAKTPKVKTSTPKVNNRFKKRSVSPIKPKKGLLSGLVGNGRNLPPQGVQKVTVEHIGNKVKLPNGRWMRRRNGKLEIYNNVLGWQPADKWGWQTDPRYNPAPYNPDEKPKKKAYEPVRPNYSRLHTKHSRKPGAPYVVGFNRVVNSKINRRMWHL